ncbi:MAG TPA: stage II sporulation protein R [Candidatus Borkfalkia stercoripullorum]|nr:stage II sporulation protein R [Candidatus Borkfalkia stercoripullorum]
MKKYCIVFVLLFIIILTAAVCARPEDGTAAAYLRLHVRANSDSAADQAVKYEVKEAIVEYLTPVAASAESKEEAVAALEAALPGIERTANAVLAENGFAYLSRAEIRAEEFPTRVYDGVTLEAGVYDALIVELGSGKGANWWCVVYPPLCFAGETGANVQYRSRIWEIIHDFFAD